MNKEDLLTAFIEIKGSNFNCHDIDRIFEEMDVDGNGLIDFNEWMNSVATAENDLSEEKLENACRVFDIDGDKLISVAEIKKILSSSMDINEAVVLKAVAEVEKYGMFAKLTFEEFKVFLKNILAM